MANSNSITERNVIDCGNAYELFAASLARVERIGQSSVRLVFANPDNRDENCHMVNLKLIVEHAALPDIIRALQNIELGGGMSSEMPLLRVVN